MLENIPNQLVTLANINQRNQQFWLEQSELLNRRMQDAALREIAASMDVRFRHVDVVELEVALLGGHKQKEPGQSHVLGSFLLRTALEKGRFICSIPIVVAMGVVCNEKLIDGSRGLRFAGIYQQSRSRPIIAHGQRREPR
jgi:hypothetical protein